MKSQARYITSMKLDTGEIGECDIEYCIATFSKIFTIDIGFGYLYIRSVVGVQFNRHILLSLKGDITSARYAAILLRDYKRRLKNEKT